MLQSKYILEIKFGNKIYKIIRDGLLHNLVKFSAVLLACIVTFAICFAWMKDMAIETQECFEENSHLTRLEQKAICTID